MEQTNRMTGPYTELEAHLDSVFEAFYEKLLSDPHFSVFFRDDEHVRSLIRRQKENLREAMTGDPSEMRDQYVRLGRLHHRIFVPYFDFALGVDFLAEQFFTIVSSEPKLAHLSGGLFNFFKAIKDYTAKGYLHAQLEVDKRDLDAFIHNLRNSREAFSGLIESHYIWLRHVLIAVEKEDEELLPELELERSEFYRWLLSDEAEQYIPDPDDRAHLFDVHRRVLTDTRNMFYFVKQEYYTELLPLYININKQLLTLNNVVTVLFTRFKMEEVVRDPLTGLFSRKSFDDSLKQAMRLAQLKKRPMSLIMSDLDDFKGINDRHGHLTGDCVLRHSADVLQRYLRTSDQAFRYGGEEFVILLQDTNLKGACQLAERIRQTIADMHFECGEGIRVTMSFGVTEFPVDGMWSARELIDRADEKLYHAKAEGKNRVRGLP